MARKILSIATFLLLFVSATAVAQVNIGYMDMQDVLDQLPERQNIEQQLNGFIQEKQQELQQEAADFQNAVAQYQQNQSSLSDQQRQTREQELVQMEQQLNEYQQSIQADIQQRRAELLQPVYNRIDEAIAAIADDMGLDFVLNKSTSMGENIVYYSSQQQMDITSKVVDRLKN